MTGADRGQTETVGVVLLTGVIVIAAGVVGVIVLDGVDTERSTMSEIDVEVGPTAYTVTHAGGDAVPVDEVRVGLTGASDTTVALSALAAVDTDGDGLFEPGETYTGYHDGTSTLRVLVIHDGTNTVLHDEQTDLPEGDGRLTWTTAGDWDRAATQTRVIHQTYGDHRGDRVELGYPTRDDGLVGFWALDEDSGSTAFDQSGTGNNGSHEGDPTLSEPGLFSTSSYEFDGTDDYVRVPDDDSLEVADSQAVTVSAWVKKNSAQSGQNWAAILQKSDESYNLQFINGDEPIFTIYDGSDWNEARAGTDVNVDQWYHIVGTYDGTTVRIYLDGSLKDTNTASRIDDSGGLDVGIGENLERTGRHLDGQMDAVRVYDRALSDSEVATLNKSAYDGTLVTGEQQYTVPVDPAGLTLTDVAATRPSGSEVLVTVESDPDSDGSFEESSDQIRLDGSASYDVTGLTTPSSRYRLRVDLSSTDPTAGPVLDGLALSTR